MATPAPPAVPNIPLTPPLAAPQTDVRNSEDGIYNKIAAAMTASMNAAPLPVVEVPPAQPVATPPPAADPAVQDTAPPIEAPPTVNTEDVDFDAVPTEEAAPKPLIPDSDLGKTIQEMIAAGALPDEVKEVFLKTSQGKRMLASFHTMRELEKPSEEGGMGRLPSIEEIRAGDVAQREVSAMRFEYAENPQSFVHNMFTFDPASGVNAMGASPVHAIKVLETIPQALSQAMRESNSPVYSQLMAAYSAPVFNGFLNTQYKEALAMPTESEAQIRAATTPDQIPMANAKARLLDALQLIEGTVFGKARPLNLGGAPAQQGESQEMLNLRRQLEQTQSQVRTGETARVTALRGNIETTAKSGAMKDIDALLDQTGVTKIHNAAILGPHKNELYRDVHEALRRFDPSGWQNYEFMLAHIPTGGEEASTAAAKQYSQMFRNALRNHPTVRTRLNELVIGAKAASDAQHADRSQAAHRTETNGAGVAAPQSVLAAAQIERQPGESREDWLTRKFAAPMMRGIPANGSR